jgi:hypothetical protein
MKKCLFFLLIFASQLVADPKVLLSILARNKAHVLPHFLYCIDNLDYDKKAITVYINTNNNIDDTIPILQKWAEMHRDEYAEILFDEHKVEDLPDGDPHHWNAHRFKVLGAIRNKGLKLTTTCRCDFHFVVDCDNFITPCTLKALVEKNVPIIAPLLRTIPNKNCMYSNYFCAVNKWGYFEDHPDYYKILYHQMIGAFEVPLVHCTYLVRADAIDSLTYVDGTDDYEFVIFSRSARNNQIPQVICNEHDFGTILHADVTTLEQEQACVEKLDLPAAEGL